MYVCVCIYIYICIHDTTIYAHVCMNICMYICIYIYARPLSQDLRFRGSRGMGRTKHCNAQKIPKFPTLKLTQHCNALKNSKNSKILASITRPGANSLKFWNFLSITVFREFQGLEKLIFFEHYSVL